DTDDVERDPGRAGGLAPGTALGPLAVVVTGGPRLEDPDLVAEDAVGPAGPAAAHDVEQQVHAPGAGHAEIARLRGPVPEFQAVALGPGHEVELRSGGLAVVLGTSQQSHLLRAAYAVAATRIRRRCGRRRARGGTRRDR